MGKDKSSNHAIIALAVEGPPQFRQLRSAVPKPQEGQILVKVSYAGCMKAMLSDLSRAKADEQQ
jgi:NADPH-dependent curcumin reductase CurA